MPEIVLAGCTPEPLMGYLKALGVLRLVAEDLEHGDPHARGVWRSGAFVLESKLDHAGLVKFFESKYQPTPLVVPWSGGDFFGVNPSGSPVPHKDTPTGTRIIEAFLSSSTARLSLYRDTIRTTLRVMCDAGIKRKADIEGKSGERMKATLLSRLRHEVADNVVPWIDAAAQLTDQKATFNPLLGSGGGNDGNTHFSDNFMQNLWECLADFDCQRQQSGRKAVPAPGALASATPCSTTWPAG